MAEFLPPDGHIGGSFQVLSSTWRRQGEAGRVDPWRQKRRDQVFRFFAAERSDGLGLRVTGTMSSSSIERDTTVADRALYQTSLEVRRTWPQATVAVSGHYGLVGSPREVDIEGGWILARHLTLAGSARHSTYVGHRSGDRGALTAGIS